MTRSPKLSPHDLAVLLAVSTDADFPTDKLDAIARFNDKTQARRDAYLHRAKRLLRLWNGT